MAETVKRFEGSDNKIIDETDAYERLLNKMFKIDEDLPLKTETLNPLETSRYFYIAEMIETEDPELLEEEAEDMRTFGRFIMVNMISHKRKGRVEAFDSIKSYNLGQEHASFSEKEQEKFRRVMKKMG